MEQDPDRVELVGEGWDETIAQGPSWRRESWIHSDYYYIMYSLPALQFSHAATLLITQGMALQNFFPYDSQLFLYEKGDIAHSVRGPFVYLRGKYTAPNDPPPRLQEVVLARVLKAPKGASKEAILAYLLKNVT